MLEDLEYYFDHHEDVRPSNGTTGDPYRECRQRYAILLTDGRPNMDFRGHPYYCEHYGGTESGGVVSGGVDRCPYDTPGEHGGAAHRARPVRSMASTSSA
jgi:hypothetical protein